MEFDIFWQSPLRGDDGEVLPREKLGVFVAEPGVDILEVQRHFRSGDFLVKPAGLAAEVAEDAEGADAKSLADGLNISVPRGGVPSGGLEDLREDEQAKRKRHHDDLAKVGLAFDNEAEAPAEETLDDTGDPAD